GNGSFFPADYVSFSSSNPTTKRRKRRDDLRSSKDLGFQKANNNCLIETIEC
ncbi:hypothetical protein MKW98_003692, partial [Papaver atlanticum]